MSSESISRASDENSSSSSTSTRCVDSHGSVSTEPDSAADSLNSLIQGNAIDNVECADSCLKVECSLANQCCGDDLNSSSKLKQRKSICCNPIGQCVWGVLLIIVAISGFIFTPLDCMLWEKLNMRPGLPPYEWWADPPDEVRLRVYVFNVTNHERFMMGLDEKLNVQEIGPIVYLEKLLHTNIVFNDNNTLTYTATRYPIFLPEENSIDLNTTLIIPNMALLGMSSYLHDASFLVRTGFRLLASSHSSQFFIKRTVYEYLWDYREPLLDTSRNLVPGLVPVTNLGVLSRIYSDFTDEITVTIGPQWGHKRFFQIDKFRGESQLPGYKYDECPDRIVGSTEGVMYHQRLTKQDVLLYWRKTVCKLMPLYFDSEIKLDEVLLYRYNLSENVFSRIVNSTDCYDTQPTLPAGLSDASKCYFNFPIVVSYPHFYTGEPTNNYVTGYQPDRYKHNSYAIVEPLTGTPFHSVARMQSNLRIHDLSGFYDDYRKFSNLVLPLFWAEYNQKGLPSKIQATIYFMTVVLPPLSIVVLVLMLYLGCHLLLKLIYVHQLRNHSLISVLRVKSKNVNNLAKNKLFSYETENFIKN